MFSVGVHELQKMVFTIQEHKKKSVWRTSQMKRFIKSTLQHTKFVPATFVLTGYSNIDTRLIKSYNPQNSNVVYIEFVTNASMNDVRFYTSVVGVPGSDKTIIDKQTEPYLATRLEPVAGDFPEHRLQRELKTQLGPKLECFSQIHKAKIEQSFEIDPRMNEHILRNFKRQCAYCQKKKTELAQHASLQKCIQCKAVCYCSRKCQKGDWKKHKVICKSLEALVSTLAFHS
jgi:hypothetical protein